MADTVPTETFTMNYEKVEWTYSKADADGDSFDFAAPPEKQEVALLLPAVQAAPEEPDPTDSFDFKAAEDGGEASLLLPAVQSAREAARRSDTDDGVQMGDGAVTFIRDTVEAGETAYEYKLDGVMISSYDVGGSTDVDQDQWIDVLSTDWGAHKPGADAGLRSDGELVQAVSEADMGGDFIF